MKHISPFEVKNDTLYVKGTPVSFRYKVCNSGSFLEVDGIAIVVLCVEEYNLERPEDVTRNVYAIDENGYILWRIQPTTSVKNKNIDETYIGIGIDPQDGRPRVFTPYGHAFDLDVKTGAVSYKFWSRM